MCKENKKKYPDIVLQDGNATGDAIVDETLQYLHDSKGPKTLREGLSATCKQYKHKWAIIYARLENEGILRADDVKKVFGSQKWYFLNKPELKQFLLNDVFTFSEASEAPSFFLLALITLLDSTSLLKKYLEKHYQHLREWRPFYGRFYQYVSKKVRQEETEGNLRFINEVDRTIDDIIGSRNA